MKTIDEIRHENLLLAIKRLKTTAALAEKAGVSAAYLSQIKNKTPESKTGKPKAMGDDVARKIERALEEPSGWMDVEHNSALTDISKKGQKSGMIPASRSHAPTSMGNEAARKTFAVRPIATYESLGELPSESTVLITRIDVQLSAGNGRETWHIEEKEPLPFQADYIRRLDAKPQNLVAVKVVGDSMEPRLFDDDTVVVDKADTRVPANAKVFALVYAGEMLVKRLQRLPDGALRIISDNPAYEPVTVTVDKTSHVTIVGRVKYRSGMGDF